MEGRARITCSECGRTREVSGEMPEEYTACFAQIVREEGFVPRPGKGGELVCGACLAKEYAGHESVDDEKKIKK